MVLHKLVRRNCDGKLPVSINYQNLYSCKEGVILLCQFPGNKNNITITWFSSLYNTFKLVLHILQNKIKSHFHNVEASKVDMAIFFIIFIWKN